MTMVLKDDSIYIVQNQALNNCLLFIVSNWEWINGHGIVQHSGTSWIKPSSLLFIIMVASLIFYKRYNQIPLDMQ